jgi:hypothetical protein
MSGRIVAHFLVAGLAQFALSSLVAGERRETTTVARVARAAAIINQITPAATSTDRGVSSVGSASISPTPPTPTATAAT